MAKIALSAEFQGSSCKFRPLKNIFRTLENGHSRRHQSIPPLSAKHILILNLHCSSQSMGSCGCSRCTQLRTQAQQVCASVTPHARFPLCLTLWSAKLQPVLLARADRHMTPLDLEGSHAPKGQLPCDPCCPPTPPKIWRITKSCDPSDHLQESPGPKSQESLEKSWGSAKRSPKIPEKVENTPKSPNLGLFRVFFDFFGYFRRLFCGPPKRLFSRLFWDFGPGAPGDSCKWSVGSQTKSLKSDTKVTEMNSAQTRCIVKARLRKIHVSGDFLGVFAFLRIACSLRIPQETFKF